MIRGLIIIIVIGFRVLMCLGFIVTILFGLVTVIVKREWRLFRDIPKLYLRLWTWALMERDWIEIIDNSFTLNTDAEIEQRNKVTDQYWGGYIALGIVAAFLTLLLMSKCAY